PQVKAADCVVEQPHLDALARLLGQQIDNALAGGIATDNEEFEVDVVARGGDRFEQSIEGLLRIVVQCDGVTVTDGKSVHLSREFAKPVPGLAGRIVGPAAVGGLARPRRVSAAKLQAVAAALAQRAVDPLIAEHAEQEGADEWYQDH